MSQLDSRVFKDK